MIPKYETSIVISTEIEFMRVAEFNISEHRPR